MPPPPPPSASYLWKFDDLSDEGEDGDDDSKESTTSEKEPQQLPKVIKPFFDRPVVDNPTARSMELSYNKSSYASPLLSESIDPPQSQAPFSHSARGAPSLCPLTAVVVSDVEDIDNINVNSDLREDPSCKAADDRNESMLEDVDVEKALNYVEPVSGIPAMTSLKQEVSTTTIKGASSLSLPRKRKKGKKKKKSTSSAAQKTNLPSPLSPRRVSFSMVHLHVFPRCLGVSVVPGDGGWPLGIMLQQVVPEEKANNSSDEQSTDQKQQEQYSYHVASNVNIDEYEEAKQQRLRQRMLLISPPSSVSLSSKGRSASKAKPVTGVLETRQWDYKRRCKNPLFGPLNETERMQLLLSATQNGEANRGNNGLDFLLSTSIDGAKSQATPHSRRVKRDNSKNSTNSGSTRGEGLVTAPTNGGDYCNGSFTDAEVRNVRHELEQIRNHRSMEGAIGCTCRKLQVYLLPKNSSSLHGKKAHHRRMKPSKVKEELRKRNLLPPEHEESNSPSSRETLEILLHEAVEQEPCCTPHSGCPCVRNGIECQADACSCWHSSHQKISSGNNAVVSQTQPHKDDESCSVNEIQARCGNPVAGMLVVDFNKIDAYRSSFLTALTICPPVSVTSGMQQFSAVKYHP